MSRVLPFKKPSWEYALWEEVRQEASLISKEEKEFISSRDRGKSGESIFWQKGGRAQSIEGMRRMDGDISSNVQDDNYVYDFIGLSLDFERWFDRLEIDSSGLLEEIENYIGNTRDSEMMKDFGKEWLEINWSILGRAIGSAIANEGKRNKFWFSSGSDARRSHDFWSRMGEVTHRGPTGINYVSSEEWDDLTAVYRQYDFDPGAEIVRSAGHRPSAPIFKGGTESGAIYSMNPLGVQHRNRMNDRYRGAKDAEEFAFFHGELTFKILRDAMRALKMGEEIKFALFIHGLCANHIMRTSVNQQKIGMHLFSNLAVRRLTRGVAAIPVPDISQDLGTGFKMGPVLQILHDAGLIEWYTVGTKTVDDAISRIKSI